MKRQKKIDDKNQEGQGLKTWTLDQMRSRLLITLAQLQAGDNSEKLKNEIRQLLNFCFAQKNWLKQSLNIWPMLFKKWKQSLWTLNVEQA